MIHRAVSRLGLALTVLAIAGCGPNIDLSKALEVVDVLSGYYDDGVHQRDLQDGGGPRAVNVLRASVTFRLKNISAEPLTSVQLMASFWQAGADGEWDSRNVTGISSTGLPPGQTTPAITIRSNTAFNLEGARHTLFEQPRFVDITLKLFAKRGGGLYKLGELKLDRTVLPHAGSGAGRP